MYWPWNNQKRHEKHRKHCLTEFSFPHSVFHRTYKWREDVPNIYRASQRSDLTALKCFRWDFLCVKTKWGEGTFPAATQTGVVTNINVPHKPRSTGEELKPTRVLHSGAIAYCDFTILERVHAGATTAAGAGVRYIPTTVQSRREVQSDGTSASIHREKVRKSRWGNRCRVTPVCVFKPANHSLYIVKNHVFSICTVLSFDYIWMLIVIVSLWRKLLDNCHLSKINY